VNVAVQSASHSCPMEMREPEPLLRAGNRWALVAFGGRVGIWRYASSVESMEAPLGRETAMGIWAGRLLMQGAVVVRKWPVQPVSAMAVGSTLV